MFETNEDFNIDEPFLPQFPPSQALSTISGSQNSTIQCTPSNITRSAKTQIPFKPLNKSQGIISTPYRNIPAVTPFIASSPMKPAHNPNWQQIADEYDKEIHQYRPSQSISTVSASQSSRIECTPSNTTVRPNIQMPLKQIKKSQGFISSTPYPNVPAGAPAILSSPIRGHQEPNWQQIDDEFDKIFADFDANEGTDPIKNNHVGQNKRPCADVLNEGVKKQKIDDKHPQNERKNTQLNEFNNPVNNQITKPNSRINFQYIKKSLPEQIVEQTQRVQNNLKISCFKTPFSPKPVVRERKFPGPAGLLPEYGSRETTLNGLFKDSNESDLESSNMESVFSQDPNNKFSKLAWKRMLKDYSENNSSLPNKYTIEWLKSMANTLAQRKAPFLAVLIDVIFNSLYLKLKDETDSIRAIIDKDVYDKFTDNIRVDCVIVLRQVGIMQFTPAGQKYLTIASNNIVCFYSNEENETNITKTDNYLTRAEFYDLEKKLSNTWSKENTEPKNPLVRNPLLLRNNYTPISLNRPHGSFSIADKSLPTNSKELRSISSNYSMGSNSYSSKNLPPITIEPTNSTYLTNTRAVESQGIKQGVAPKSNENRLKAFVFSPRISQDVEKLGNGSQVVNQSGSLDENDVESIINCTLEGVNTDALFDDF